MSAEELAKCFELNDFGWPESLMFWQWRDDEVSSSLGDAKLTAETVRLPRGRAGQLGRVLGVGIRG